MSFIRLIVKNSGLFAWSLSLCLMLVYREFYILFIVGFICFIAFLLFKYLKRLLTNRLSRFDKIPIIPEFKLPKNIEFYEIGVLIDGQVHSSDLLASAIYYRAQLEKDSTTPIDMVGKSILDNLGTDLNIAELYEYISSNGTERLGNVYKDTHKITMSIYNNLENKKLIRYNPQRYYRILEVVEFILIASTIILCFLSNSLNISVLIISFYLIINTLLQAIMELTFLLHLNRNKLDQIRADIFGYKRFLETTEKYKFEQDRELFLKTAPYFLIMNIDQSLWRDLTHKALESSSLK